MRQTFVDILLATMMAAIVTLLVGVSDRSRQVAAPAADAAPAGPAVRFATLDVYVDPRGTPMAAYQVEITPKFEAGKEITFVSLSGGGTHPAFREVPAYDKRALAVPESRLILAAFSLQDDLPKNKTRVAQVDVAYSGTTPPAFVATPMVVSTADARRIKDATVTLQVTPREVH